MRFNFLYFIFCASVIFAKKYPSSTGLVNDFANVISTEYEEQINNLITEVEQKTSAEIAVVTVNTVAPVDIESYAVELFEKWGIGKKGKDNGVLIIAAIDDRKMRIEVGYGLEGILPDGFCGEIIRQALTPNFKEGNFGQGFLTATKIIAGKIGEEYGVQITGAQKLDVSSSQIPKAFGMTFIIWGIILLFLIGGRFFLPVLLFTGRGRRGYWSGGGILGDSGGFSGGFGGFGGGMSGGGGASGGW